MDPEADTKSRPQISTRLSETISMIEKWASNRDAVLVFHPNSTAALLWTGKHQRLPITLTETDQLYEPLRRRILSSVVNVRSGDVLIISNDFFAIQPLEQEVLREVVRTWAGDLIDVSSTLSIYRLKPKQQGHAGDLVVPREATAFVSKRPIQKDVAFINPKTSLITRCWRMPAAGIDADNITFDLEQAHLVDKIWIGACPDGDSQLPSYDVLLTDDMQNWHQIAVSDFIRSAERLEAKLPVPTMVRSIQLLLTSLPGKIKNSINQRVGFVMTN